MPMLTESQKNRVEVLLESLENDNVDGEEFTNIMFELQDEGVDVQKVLTEDYGVDFDE